MECHFYSGIMIPPSAGGWELLFVVMSSFSANINFPSSSADIYILSGFGDTLISTPYSNRADC